MARTAVWGFLYKLVINFLKNVDGAEMVAVVMKSLSV